MAMRDDTKLDLLRLQMYGAMYMGGFQPPNIEAYFDEMVGSSLLGAFDAIGGGDAAKINADAQLEGAITQGIATAASVIPVVGSIISVVTGVVGAIASSTMSAQAFDKCDSSDCWSDPIPDMKKLIVGHSAPMNYYSEYHGTHVPAAVVDEYRSRGDCFYGIANRKHCWSRHAAILAFTNDGSWFYKIPNGTVIGITGRAKPGSLLQWCQESYRDRPYTPRTSGDPIPVNISDKLAPRTILNGEKPAWLLSAKDSYANYPNSYTKEYSDRMRSVTMYLDWCETNMPISLLSCMERLLVNTVVPSNTQEKIIKGDPNHPEFGLIKKGVIKGGEYVGTMGDPTPARRKLASRYYASIMSMFEVLLKVTNVLGRKMVAEIASEYEGQLSVKLGAEDKKKAEDAVKAILGNTTNGVSRDDIRIWPAAGIAKAMTYPHLVYTISRTSDKLVELGRRISSGLPVYIEKDNKLIRLNASDLAIDSRSQVAWVSSHTGPSIPVILGGVAAVAVAAFIVWKAFED
jgi:hypothetical protein